MAVLKEHRSEVMRNLHMVRLVAENIFTADLELEHIVADISSAPESFVDDLFCCFERINGLLLSLLLEGVDTLTTEARIEEILKDMQHVTVLDFGHNVASEVLWIDSHAGVFALFRHKVLKDEVI